MLEIVNITPEFAIGPQISIKDFKPIQATGFASILNARPDDEEGAFLRSLDAEQHARSHKLAYAHSPTENHAIFETEVIDRFEQALAKLPKPIFAHCKTGTRCAILWALVASRHRPVEHVINVLRSAGQDLDFLEQELRDSAAASRRSPIQLKDDALLSLGRSKLLDGMHVVSDED